MKLSSPHAVIFDWDNTLVDTWPIIHEALEVTFAAMGQPAWSIEQTKARVRKSMRDSFPGLFGEDWQKAGEVYQKHYRDTHLQKLTPLPGAEGLLKAVKMRGIYSVVVSNKKGQNLRQEVEHLGWLPYFNCVVGSDDAAKDKPHREPVLHAFEETDIVPGPDVWFIGDSEIDLECALNTGCTAILYGESALAHPEFTETHYQGFPYHAHVHSHAEMAAMLNEATAASAG